MYVEVIVSTCRVTSFIYKSYFISLISKSEDALWCVAFMAPRTAYLYKYYVRKREVYVRISCTLFYLERFQKYNSVIIKDCYKFGIFLKFHSSRTA